MTALLKEHHRKGDSPIKKKIEEVRTQWQKRIDRLVVMQTVEPSIPQQLLSSCNNSIFLPGNLFNTSTNNTSTNNIYASEDQQPPINNNFVEMQDALHGEPISASVVQVLEPTCLQVHVNTNNIYDSIGLLHGTSDTNTFNINQVDHDGHEPFVQVQEQRSTTPINNAVSFFKTKTATTINDSIELLHGTSDTNTFNINQVDHNGHEPLGHVQERRSTTPINDAECSSIDTLLEALNFLETFPATK